MRALIQIAFVGLIIAGNALADVPGKINYQGRLTDGSGIPVSDGSYGVTFTLYYLPSGNSPTGWSEVQNVSTTNGYFNIELGGTSPLSSVDFSLPYYLGLWVAGDSAEMTPRHALNSVPYARNVADNSISMVKIQNRSATETFFIDDGPVRSHSIGESEILNLDINVRKSSNEYIAAKVMVGKSDAGVATLNCILRIDGMDRDHTAVCVSDTISMGNFTLSIMMNFAQGPHNIKVITTPYSLTGTYYTQYATLTVIACYK